MKLKLSAFAMTMMASIAFVAFPTSGADNSFPKHTFVIGTNDFLLDNQKFQIRCGEIHAPRVPREYWRHRLQMAKAMGLNTVCAYLFWNMHEPRPGEFDWSGQANAAEFCRIAQEEGLWVILRPGPYACAEWEMGGFPWWLLKTEDIKLRTRDPRYLDAAKKYLKEVGRVLGPLQITQGGPILMVQVENEYGFYGKDADYMGELRQAMMDGGFDVPLFACNPPYTLKNGWRSDLFPVVNFGSDPAGGFKALREILPQGPLMCGEFYPGWFDTWGAPHHLGNEQKYLTDLEYMLKAGASFSIYMAHGGTTFGLWSGADRPFKPDTSSYDYDAPISEAGWTTEKFFKTRELFSKYLLPGETIPEPPAKNPVITFASAEAKESASFFHSEISLRGLQWQASGVKMTPSGVHFTTPETMERLGQGHGLILYRTILHHPDPEATLEVPSVHDFGFVFLNGKSVGVMDRRNGNYKVLLPAHEKEAQLDILVEAMGRVNFGQEVHDRKGISGPVKLTVGGQPDDWSIYSFPLDEKMLENLSYTSKKFAGPAFWRAFVNIKQPGDTFLDLRTWGKGVVWVNGHCLGRYWNIGPTQTAYVPGCWLRAGKNEFVILDLLGPEKPVIAGLEKPILDELHPEKDFARARRPNVTLKLDSVKPLQTGSFAPGAATQEIKFAEPGRGRYFCIESLSAQDGKAYAAIAELELLDESGKPLSHEGWTIAFVDSEERDKEDGTAENAIDGQTANFWHTQWSAAQPNHPHQLVIDLGQARAVSGFRYTPRQGDGTVGGRIKDYRVYVGDGLIQK
jgi:beta-galactosidase